MSSHQTYSSCLSFLSGNLYLPSHHHCAKVQPLCCCRDAAAPVTMITSASTRALCHRRHSHITAATFTSTCTLCESSSIHSQQLANRPVFYDSKNVLQQQRHTLCQQYRSCHLYQYKHICHSLCSAECMLNINANLPQLTSSIINSSICEVITATPNSVIESENVDPFNCTNENMSSQQTNATYFTKGKQNYLNHSDHSLSLAKHSVLLALQWPKPLRSLMDTSGKALLWLPRVWLNLLTLLVSYVFFVWFYWINFVAKLFYCFICISNQLMFAWTVSNSFCSIANANKQSVFNNELYWITLLASMTKYLHSILCITNNIK